jgi:UDP-glucose 4-epimerase
MVKPTASCVVLGGGGFIGTNLCRRLLVAGHRVRAFGRGRLFVEAMEGVEWVQGDFSDTAALAGAIATFDVVYHLVHGAVPLSANLDMASDVQKSIIGSLAMFDLCRKLGVSRVIFVSSGGTIYGRPQAIPTPETAPTEPISAYGISKLAIEKYLALYQYLYQLDYRILRVSNPFGPFQTPIKGQGVIAALIARALHNETIEIWGDGSTVRDFIFIDDVIDAMVAVAQDAGTERIYNIGSGTGRSLREVVAAIEALLHRNLKIELKRARPFDVPVSVLAIDRAREALEWAPRTTFEGGMNKTIEWWQRFNAGTSGSCS